MAGAQSKVPVVLIDRRIALPLPGQATTHILKPPIARFPGTTENEAFVKKLGATIGLDIAPVEPRSAEGRSFLLVERYDRVRDASGVVRRIHQEDFCQALGVPPETKYASGGGPTFKDCFELLRRVSARPATDVLKLLDAAIFNLVVGNADAHGKNFSILYDDHGPRLAPLHDLLSTVALSRPFTENGHEDRETCHACRDGRGWMAGFCKGSRSWFTFGTPPNYRLGRLHC
ncbi:HipA protein (plasmid) [Sinorhizobium fredii CCBAU 83666]|nr:HipA protein [Sinorhizobium fredii CCBAU 83666]